MHFLNQNNNLTNFFFVTGKHDIQQCKEKKDSCN